jgi:hypothetical protein
MPVRIIPPLGTHQESMDKSRLSQQKIWNRVGVVSPAVWLAVACAEPLEETLQRSLSSAAALLRSLRNGKR